MAGIFLLVALTGVGETAQAEERPIRSGAEYDYPPFCFVDADDRANGFSVELLRAALQAMGRSVTFRIGPWADVKSLLERGEIDALPLVGRTPEREAAFDFTVPYLTMHGAIVVRADTSDIRDLSDLRGRHVAVMQGDNAEEFLRREDREILIHTTPTFEDALRELSEGRHDAVVIQRLVGLSLIKETGLTNLKIVNKPIDGFKQDFCFAVQEGDKDTLALLNEGLAIVVADGTYRRLHAKWFAALELPAHRRIVVGGDHNYPPYEYLDENGRPAGYNVELTRAIAQEVGVDIEIRLGPWSDIVQGLESGEIDVIQGIFYSEKRDEKFDFTQEHTVNHCVSVVRKGEGPTPITLAELAGKRIVVQRGDIMHDFAVEHGLANQISAVDSQEDALRELAQGQHDCALLSRMTAFYWIKKNGWNNLVVGRRPFLSPQYCYAVRNNQKALLTQFGEGLKVLDETGEYRRIYEKWMGVYQEGASSFSTTLRYIAMVAVPLLAVLFASFMWTWSLRKQVARRTKDLHRSEDLLNTAQSISKIGGWEWDADHHKWFWTEETYRIYDLDPSRDLPAGREQTAQILNCYAEEDRPHILSAFRCCLDEGGAYELESRFTTTKGRKLWVRTTGRAVMEKGRVVRVVGSIQDVTDSKRAEQALRESEIRFRALFENAPLPYQSLNEKGFFLDVNRKWLDTLGYEKDEVVGRWFGDFLGQGFVEHFDRNFPMFKQACAIDGVEFDMVKKDGQVIQVAFNGRIQLDGEGRFVCTHCIFVDITERRRAEEERDKLHSQLLQAQKMESVGRLAGGVAHDFNNMLGVIMGHAELALDEIDPAQSIFKDLQEIRKAAQRSADLTRQLLAFARKQTVNPKVLDINETVEGMLKMLRRLIGEDIQLAWLPVADLWTIKVDPAQIDQILANMCVNARDAIAGVGKVTIETKNVTFDASYCAAHADFPPGDFVLLAVSDNGCGMDKDVLGKVFEPFFTTKEMGKGTGLGLATVYGIVKQNNGFINVYSEPGQGTTFKIYLPRTEVQVFEEQTLQREQKDLKGAETILLVEDEESILALAKAILERHGYKVLPARSPIEAMHAAQAHPDRIHLLITDVVMPGMNGKDLNEKLGALKPGLKCIFMSGYTANVIAHHGILDEGIHFIQKPFSVKAIAEKVREVLDV
jgi:PAS domain S-box-containing protein